MYPCQGSIGGNALAAAASLERADIQACFWYAASTQRQRFLPSCGRNGGFHVVLQIVARRCNSQMCTTKVTLPEGTDGTRLGHARCFKSATNFSPVFVSSTAVDEEIREFSIPQLLMKTTRPCLRNRVPSSLSDCVNSIFSCTTNLSPKGTSWETDVHRSFREAVSPDADETKHMVAVIRVDFGHIGTGGTGSCILSSRSLGPFP
mmetsp:Transcript_73181/g.145155  ORF Transcript_73181/g.145155 Transcript_73181/m.145155 type:complete len:205 (+) Transcript_73181:618-1232(+)